MQHAGVTGPAAAGRPGGSSLPLWAGRIGVGAAAFAVGSALGRAGDPLQLALGACLGVVAIAAAVTRLRWCLVGVLFLLVAYVPDVVATHSVGHGLTAIVLAGALVGWVARREQFSLPPELIAFGALLLAYLAASAGASDRPAAAAETLDLVSYGVIVGLLMLLLDTPVWLRRALWAIVLGVGLLAGLAILQQVAKAYGSTFGGFATVLPAGDAMRSAGPLNPNPFGQVLLTAAVLAFYLGRGATQPPARALAWSIAAACTGGVVYTQSRAALIALVIVAVAIGLLQGVRLRVLAVAVAAAIALGSVVVPSSLSQRVDALAGGTSATSSFRDNNSLRGRTSENLAALHMWADHPLVGVGPDNFEVHYLDYSTAIGIDQRDQARGAHNLYLEAFAELGLLGGAAFLTLIWLSVRGAWRLRSRLSGRDALLGEGIAVALGAFLICALTLHSAYARYEWIFLGLGLAAGCLARRPAR
ncbi:MAG TPA: O-antigen ligase family protein [Thermoleophilaceae bacterium]|nr:O-antigen ligase family protein [Thermoleophilaceae bacterium]